MPRPSISRRQFLQRSSASALGLAALGAGLSKARAAAEASLPPMRVITHGPQHHWFGYYDKLQFDPTSRFVLGMQVDFEHRSPTAEDEIRVGMVDLEDGDRWIELGTSRAWCWQQGCMLQWRPGSDREVLWNDRQGDRYVCHIMDVETRERRTIPHPIYALSPDGKSAVTPDFRRLGDMRPGYGYNGLADPYVDELAPHESGCFHVDLETGASKLILSLADVARTGVIPQPQFGIKHYFNHLLFSPDGGRFIVLHRWRYADGSRLTRMLTARPDGSDVRVVIPNGYASHFIWRDPGHILSQSRHYAGNDAWADFLFEDVDGGGDVQEVGHGVLDPSGHLSYLPGGKWILNDTYPQGPERLQTPHLYQVATGRRIDLGHFHSPAAYTGEWRVDTHPRYSPDARYVCIDSPHANEGRQLHLIDISAVVG
ncbi:MAG: hypothetical protein KDA63_11070 [Planctomycetales bacterium]|nr:hypothetical protein [Planctomycetales bacterium]